MISVTLHNLWIPVLGAGEAKLIIYALFALFMLGSWIWKFFTGLQQGQGQVIRNNPPQPRQRPAEQDLQAEINRFLRQVTGQKEPEEVEELEIIEDEELPQRSRPKPVKQRPQAAKQKPPTKANATERPPQSRERPGGKISQRKGPGSRDLGSNVREHLAEHMQSRLGKQTEQHFAHGVSERVERDLGSFTAGIAPASQGSAEKKPENSLTRNVVSMLRNPDTVQQAFVLNLILNRPATRGRSRSDRPA